MRRYKMMFHKFFELHKWKKIGPEKPIKIDDEFSNEAHIMALGECTICGKRQMQQVFGTHQWWGSDEITYKIYMKEFNGDIK